MTAEYKKDFLINTLYFATVIGIFFIALRYLPAYFLPFLIGVIVAFLVQKPAKKISLKTSFKKQHCAVALTIVICILFFAVFTFLIWVMGNKLVDIIGLLPGYFSKFQGLILSIRNRAMGNMPSLTATQKDSIENIVSQASDSLLTTMTKFVSSVATGLIKGLPAFLVTGIVTVVASCYIAKDYDRLKRFAVNMFSPSKKEMLSKIKGILHKNTYKFIKGYALISAITFLELALAFIILRIKNAVLLALIVALIDMLPVLGVGTVLIPWSAIEFLGQEYYLGFGLLISYCVIMIVHNFIEPKIISSQMGVNPIFTLIAMFLGLKVAGLVGMIASPLALTVVIEYYSNSAEGLERR